MFALNLVRSSTAPDGPVFRGFSSQSDIIAGSGRRLRTETAKRDTGHRSRKNRWMRRVHYRHQALPPRLSVG
jgi:hypothetical protein